LPKKKQQYDVGQLFNFAHDSYLERTSRPIYAVIFLLPFIVFYELGTILINTNILRQYWQGRVVAFAWLQNFLEYLGFSSKFTWVTTPLTVIVILLALQLASHKSWRFWIGDMVPMALESIVLAIPLIVLGLFINSAAAPKNAAPAAPLAAAGQVQTVPLAPETHDNQAVKVLADSVTGIGAGIYEELVFRLVLICLLMMLLQDFLGLSHGNAILLSVFISAGLFSAYHHIDFFSGRLYRTTLFSPTEFIFRTLAGIYFAVLFAVRGFGITAGTHIFYDIVATVTNACFFSTGN